MDAVDPTRCQMGRSLSLLSPLPACTSVPFLCWALQLGWEALSETTAPTSSRWSDSRCPSHPPAGLWGLARPGICSMCSQRLSTCPSVLCYLPVDKGLLSQWGVQGVRKWSDIHSDDSERSYPLKWKQRSNWGQRDWGHKPVPGTFRRKQG